MRVGYVPMEGVELTGRQTVYDGPVEKGGQGTWAARLLKTVLLKVRVVLLT